MAISETSLRWHDVGEKPFALYGLLRSEDGSFCRVPPEVAAAISPALQNLALHTAGGRVRFQTDSPVLSVQAGLIPKGPMPHMPMSGSSGFDLYQKTAKGYVYLHTFVPQSGRELRASCALAADGLGDYTLFFPLYHGVQSLSVGLAPDATLAPSAPYPHSGPIVFYGSSITQGGCASRPGHAYQAWITKWFDTDHINLGFSGNGRGEPEMARWMASLPMGMFVSDYDFNAPDADHLEATHFPLYETIRAAHPDIPYLMLSRPTLNKAQGKTDRRHAIIRASYTRARAAGDRRVYFIGGDALFGETDRDVCTVDTTHPTDEGFYRMAQCIARLLHTLDW